MNGNAVQEPSLLEQGIERHHRHFELRVLTDRQPQESILSITEGSSQVSACTRVKVDR